MGTTCSRDASATPSWRQRRGARRPATTRATGNPFAESFVASADPPARAEHAGPPLPPAPDDNGEDNTTAGPGLGPLGAELQEHTSAHLLDAGVNVPIADGFEPQAAATNTATVAPRTRQRGAVPELVVPAAVACVSGSTRQMPATTRAPPPGSRSLPQEDVPLVPHVVDGVPTADRHSTCVPHAASVVEGNLISFSASVTVADQRAGPHSNSSAYQGQRHSTSSGGRSFLVASTYFASRSNARLSATGRTEM